MSAAPLLQIETLTIGTEGVESHVIVDAVSLTIAPGAILSVATYGSP